MLGDFDIPSIDHLIEGVDYEIVSWSFADGADTGQTPKRACPEGFKMIFGRCRRLKNPQATKSGREEPKSSTGTVAPTIVKRPENLLVNSKPVFINDSELGWVRKGGRLALARFRLDSETYLPPLSSVHPK